jgi:hypothetical protein
MGSRFVVSLIGTFLVTLTVLIGAGYAVTQMAVRQPRDPFRAGSFEFDLAPGWWCELSGTEYVCTPAGKAPHAAIAVIAIKERNAQDSLQAYEEHLRNPQRSVDRGKETNALSEVRYVRRHKLGTVEWVEALHVGSEIANYHTYYLGTTTSHLGILVTMSVHKDHEAEYVRRLNEMMMTLNLYQR